MRAFLDTEFTDFLHIDLISLALVPERGKAFYAERHDFRLEDCSQFAKEAVLPKLGSLSRRLTKVQLSEQLRAWFEVLTEPVEVLYDFGTDWELLVDVLSETGIDAVPSNLAEHGLLKPEVLQHPAFRLGQESVYRAGHDRHQALGDALALKAGFDAWAAATARLAPS